MLKRAWQFYDRYHRFAGAVELTTGAVIMSSGLSGGVAIAAVVFVPRAIRHWKGTP